MKLSHYTGEPLKFDPERTYEQSAMNIKPVGFWVSVDGEYDWVDWCYSEQWGTDRLAERTECWLADGHNVLILSTEEDLLAFTLRYGGQMSHTFLYIDWPRVAQDYDGLIIAPYLWSLRLDHRVNWYYGWDCASGCIWNLSALGVPTYANEEKT